MDIPCILYNIPGRCGCGISERNVERLAAHPNIMGIKEASGNVAYAAKIAHLLSDDFRMYSGEAVSKSWRTFSRLTHPTRKNDTSIATSANFAAVRGILCVQCFRLINHLVISASTESEARLSAFSSPRPIRWRFPTLRQPA